MSTKPNVSITVYRDENIEKAIRRFKKLCERAGIKKQFKAKSRYEKPSDKKRRETRKSVRDRQKLTKPRSPRRNPVTPPPTNA